MNGLLDKELIDVPCPHCSHKAAQPTGKLKLNPKLTCSRCRKEFAINANELRAGINKIEKKLADLQRALGRLGK